MSSLRNIRLLIQYDGTRYLGWQRLGQEQRTIQGRLEAVLSRMSGEPVRIVGAGRTDAAATRGTCPKPRIWRRCGGRRACSSESTTSAASPR